VIRSRIALVGFGVVAMACGARGAPFPPLRLLPPTPPELVAAQRGVDAVLRFSPLPATVMSADGVLVDLDRVEILMLSQSYPALTADLLALALDRERRDRLEEARTAVADAEAATARRRREAEVAAAIAAAEAAGEEPPVFEEPAEVEEEDPADDEEFLTADEIAIRRLPSTVRQAWREAEVYPGTILEAAEQLAVAVDELWDHLGMPTALVDIDRLPILPDPILVVEAAERVARTRRYETVIDPGIFEEEAEILISIPFEELGNHRQGSMVQITHPVGLPARGTIRTRYFFALRTVSSRDRESKIEQVVALAPSAVPLPPTALQPAVLTAGVLLLWEPPAADVLGVELDPDEINYYVYRRPATEGASEATLLTPAPLTEPVFLDVAMEWNDRHVYEVRAIAQPPPLEEEDPDLLPPPLPAVVLPGALTVTTGTAPPGPRKESAGMISDPVRVQDIFPPLTVLNFTAVRAASRVTLRWTAVVASDLRGYRVYRHAAPAPELPGRVEGLIYADPLPPVEPDTEDIGESETEAEDIGEVGTEAEDIGEVGTEAEDIGKIGTETEEIGEAGTDVEGVAGETEVDDVVGPDPAAQAPTEPETSAARRQLRNRLTTDGWEMLTPVVISERRFIDPLSDDSVTWIYVVEAVDTSGNVSLPASAVVPAEEES